MSALTDHVLFNAAIATLLAPLAYASRWLGRPMLTHAMWLIVLIRLVVPPVWCLPWSSGTSEPPLAEPLAVSEAPVFCNESPTPFSEPPPPIEMATTAVAESVSSWTMPWWELTLGLWLLVAVVFWGRLVIHALRFHRLLQYATPTEAATQQLVGKLARRLGLRRAPRVVMIPARLSPCVWCFGRRPILLLPQDWTLRQQRLHRAAVLVHELAHLRRGDHWVRWFELIVTGLFWWLPTVWFARHHLREAEELCCDGWVIATLPAARQAYATALIDMADYLAPLRPALPPLASGFGQVHELRRRLHMILHAKPAIRAGRSGAAIALGLGLFLFPIGFDRSPAVHGQEPRADRERRERDDQPPERTERERDRERERERERAAEERARDRARATEERERATVERERAVEARNREANRRDGVQAELRAELAAAQKQLAEAQRAVERIRARMNEMGMDVPADTPTPSGGGRGGQAPRVSEPARGGGSGGGRGGSSNRDTPAPEARGSGRGQSPGAPPPPPDVPAPLPPIRETRTPVPPREPMTPEPPRGGPGGGSGRTTPAPGGPPAQRNPDDRVQQLERQLDALRRELEAMRREMRRDGERRPDSRPPQP